ncbi:MAG: ATP-binding protein [Candidatus Woesearchaeota archaeon]
MEKSFIGFFRLFFPVRRSDRNKLEELNKVLEREQIKYIKYMLKQGIISIDLIKNYSLSDLGDIGNYFQLILKKKDKEVEKNLNEINGIIKEYYNKNSFSKFAKRSDIITKYIAPNIIGMDIVKQAVTLQLFSKEKIHILLLGDPATGKTDILRSVQNLAPVSSFGLGSGTTGVGLSISVVGKEISKGLLPMADNGICCIDELNLMKQEDQASLYNAMEKGFVTYDKGNTHIKFDARIRLLATANPKDGKFRQKLPDIKKQLPFEPALISRFHLVFIIKKPSEDEFIEITRNIVLKEKEKHDKKSDIDFIKEYIDYAQKKDVEFDNQLEPTITNFIKDLKKKEDEFIIEISPRLIIGIMNMSKARARMQLKNKVDKEDLQYVLNIVEKSLKI